jgi:hypothetical protein
MKKVILSFVLSLTTLYAVSQENKIWHLGIQISKYDNTSKFSGGSPDANARFYQNKFNGSSFDFVVRYDYDKHWMLSSGLNLNAFGFGFALAENYSLQMYKNRFSSVNTEIKGLEIPLMAFYKFNFNCKNNRWLLGAGFVGNFTEGKTNTTYFNKVNDATTNTNYLTVVSSSKNGWGGMLRFAIAREKVFKRGAILNASLVFNAGLSTLATAKVNYTVDGKEYNHEFTNNGNFVGLRLAYFFRPLGSSSKQNLKKSDLVK